MHNCGPSNDYNNSSYGKNVCVGFAQGAFQKKKKNKIREKRKDITTIEVFLHTKYTITAQVYLTMCGKLKRSMA